jgi:hypothetical protein
MTKTIYYTYAWLRIDGTPYYIGKGHDRRAWVFRKKGVNRPRDRSRIIILKKEMSEGDAFRHEVYMIHVLGRKDQGTGILHNRTDGGEGLSGFVYSDELRKVRSIQFKSQGFSERHRKNLSLAQTGEKNHRYGKPASNRGVQHKKEAIQKMSDLKKGENNPAHGRKWWVNVETGETLFDPACPGSQWKRGRKR